MIVDPKVASLENRFHNMTVASGISIAQAANAHFNCLAILALESAAGDKEKAAGILRRAMEELIAGVHEPSRRKKLQIAEGLIVGPREPTNDN